MRRECSREPECVESQDPDTEKGGIYRVLHKGQQAQSYKVLALVKSFQGVSTSG